METQKLYYKNVYQTEFSAKVLHCTEGKKGWEIVLDQTCFYPEGGGQPWDTGRLGDAAVFEVHEKNGEIVHLCDRPLQGDVFGQIDWDRRFDLMQQHSGEHIVSGLIHQKYGYENVGFHMGADMITIDLSGELDEAALKEIERDANAYIWSDTASVIQWPSAEELREIPYRSKKELTGAVRIVTFPGADCCACCGLHVNRTGEIGLVKLLTCQKFREGVRIEMLCGGRAFAYCNAILTQNTLVSQRLSAKPMQTAQAVTRLAEENDALNYRLTGLENRIFEQTAVQYTGQKKILHMEPGLNSDALRRLAIAIMDRTDGYVFVFSGENGKGYKYAFGKNNGDLRSLTKETNQALRGRGGGKPSFSQGSVEATDTEIKAFFESIGQE